jgi:multidrug efflux pump subunit AcrB
VSALSRLSLRFRAVTALITIAVILTGVVSLTSLKQELIPPLELPAAVVVAIAPGMSPEVIEDQVTAPIEEAVASVRGIDEITSRSSANVSTTTVLFDYGTDMTWAAQQVQVSIGRIAQVLPDDVETQVVTGSLDDLPVVQLAVAGPDDVALTSFVEDVLVPELEDVRGVRSVAITGAAEPEIVVTPDLMALAQGTVDVEQLHTVLERNGVVIPAGQITEGSTTWTVQVGSALTSVAEIEALPLGEGDLRLGDVATVTEATADPSSYSRLDGQPALAISVTKTPEGNTVDVSRAVADVVEDLAELSESESLEVAVVFDQAPFIEESINGLTEKGLLGLGFAVVVILVFLLSLSTTLVSAVSIPLSLLAAFTVMYATGYTLNLLTLSALTIAIGRVVDDSIVVIENIKRHLSYGEPKMDAITGALREVAAAITASTVATVAVFLPIGLVGGLAGELFRPFALTVALAMGASLLVAITIVPVLAYWFVRAPQAVDEAEAARIRAEAEAKERRTRWQRAYVPTLDLVLRRPAISLVVAFAILGGTAALVPQLETNLLGDSGSDALTVTQTFRAGTSLDAQDEAARVVEAELLGVDGVATVQTTVGSDPAMAAFFGGAGASATFAITVADDADATAVREDLEALLEQIPADDVTTDLAVASGDMGRVSSAVELIVTAADTEALAAATAQVTARAREVDGVAKVRDNLAADTEVVQVTVDREVVSALGLSETAVAGMVAGAMNPLDMGEVILDSRQVPVKLDLGTAPTSLEALRAVQLVPGLALGDVASVDVVTTPSSITRVDGHRTASVTVTPAGQDLGGLSARLVSAMADVDLPPGADVEVGGAAAEQDAAFEDLLLALVIAIAITYIVMVATFNSLAQPFILLISVPFAATGAIGALLLTGTPLGVPALIGMLMLVGIVVSNAIVLIDLVNQYRERGRSLDEAVREGARKRLRPIVMTAAATIFALLPMALGIADAGGFISQPLALVVIGGLVTSTLLTLLLVPVLYVLWERGVEKRAARRAARHGGPSATVAAEAPAAG